MTGQLTVLPEAFSTMADHALVRVFGHCNKKNKTKPRAKTMAWTRDRENIDFISTTGAPQRTFNMRCHGLIHILEKAKKEIYSASDMNRAQSRMTTRGSSQMCSGQWMVLG